VNLKLLLSSVALLSLTGCSFIPWFEEVEKIETVTTAVERPRLNLEQPEPLKLKRAEWIIVTRENAEEVFERLEATGQPVALFAMTAEGYESLALNIQDIKGYLQIQKSIIVQYKEYYEPINNNSKETAEDARTTPTH
jgi:hypothetical protein